MTKIKNTLNRNLIEESRNDKYIEYSVFEDLQDVSNWKSVAFVAYDSAIS